MRWLGLRPYHLIYGPLLRTRRLLITLLDPGRRQAIRNPDERVDEGRGASPARPDARPLGPLCGQGLRPHRHGLERSAASTDAIP
jgi:hypothetical protein